MVQARLQQRKDQRCDNIDDCNLIIHPWRHPLDQLYYNTSLNYIIYLIRLVLYIVTCTVYIALYIDH